jgi:hypothetical protein
MIVPMDRFSSSASRREFIQVFTAAAGIASPFFAGTLYALTDGKREQKVTKEIIDKSGVEELQEEELNISDTIITKRGTGVALSFCNS